MSGIGSAALILCGVIPGGTWASVLSSSTQTPVPSVGLGWIIAWIVCANRKKYDIGGWLLSYYWQIYSGVVVSVALVFGMSIQNFLPEYFGSTQRYLLFLVSAAPSLVLLGVQCVIATFLLNARRWDLLVLLRYAIGATLAAELIGFGIDLFYFHDELSLFLDVYSIIPTFVWFLYFIRSVRVRKVFKTHDWETAPLAASVMA